MSLPTVFLIDDSFPGQPGQRFPSVRSRGTEGRECDAQKQNVSYPLPLPHAHAKLQENVVTRNRKYMETAGHDGALSR